MVCTIFLSVFARLTAPKAGIFRAPWSRMAHDRMQSMRAPSLLILEAAGVLGVSRRTVYYRIREGRLQTIRTRGGSQRVLWSSIEAFLRETQAAPPPDQQEGVAGG
jgi:excisionase family DNA binding protein